MGSPNLTLGGLCHGHVRSVYRTKSNAHSPSTAPTTDRTAAPEITQTSSPTREITHYPEHNTINNGGEGEEGEGGGRVYRSEHVSQCLCAYNITTSAVNGGEPSVATRDRSQAAEKRNPRKERADDRAGKEHGRVGEGCKQGGRGGGRGRR